MTNIEHFASV